jgi:putative transposase
MLTRTQGGRQQGAQDNMAALPRPLHPQLPGACGKKGQRQAVLATINTIFVQETLEAASGQWRAVADQLHEVLAFIGFHKAHRTPIHCTNQLDRLNAKVKRRSNVIGIFPNDQAIIRQVGALMLEQNDEWSLQRRYMQLEGLQSLSESQSARLSAVIN